MEKERLNLLRTYYQENSAADIQLESFNYFINHSLHKIISDKSDIVIEDKYKLSFKDVFVDYPGMIEEDRNAHPVYPIEARTRDINYDGTLTVNLVEWVEGVEKHHFKVPLTKIPIMVNSCRCNLSKLNKQQKIKAGECENDPGGYFIINGKERVIVAQERINYNQIYIYSTQKHSHNVKYSYIAEIRSMSDETGHSALVECMIDHNRNIFFNIPYIKKEIPLHMLFSALEIDQKEFETLVTRGVDESHKTKFLELTEYTEEMTSDEALECISQFPGHNNSQNSKNYVKQIITRELFPHVGVSTFLYKDILCNMVRKLLLVCFELRKPDDRDNVSNKRVESTGVLIGELFRSLYKKFIKNLEVHLSRRMDALAKIPLCSPTITQGLNYVFSTGNWTSQHTTSYVRTGVSQIMTRLSYIGMIAYLRKTVIPVGKETKNSKIRQIHESAFGFIDPVETPEGQFSGITKSFSFLVRITNSVTPSFVCDVIDKFKLLNDEKNQNRDIMISLCGRPLGYVDTSGKNEFLKRVKHLKYTKALPRDVSIIYDDVEKEVRIYCEAGRLIRPVFTTNKPDFNKSWKDMLYDGTIVYIDTNEAERSVIGLEFNAKADYYEIHPLNFLGVCSGVIVFSDHSQAPRNIYSTNMMKQAIGVYALNNDLRTDTIAHMLCYPQKQLVTTCMSRFLKARDMPSGINAVVAIASYSGFNQEDSVIINKASIERGMFRTVAFRTVIVEESRRNIKTTECIRLPSEDIRKKYYNYSKLDKDGIIRQGVYVDEKDVIVGKVTTKASKTDTEDSDVSVVVKSNEVGFVDKVFVTTTTDGYKMVKIKIRSVRIPEIGDKVASTHGQKGTIGALLPQEDMPFSCSSGIVPDIILNPAAIPSRMTINYILEGVLGKAATMEGDSCPDATPFTSNSVDIARSLAERLHKSGFKYDGTEVMYSGFTGKPLVAQIFSGVIYYQRLKHLVAEKLHMRAYGPIQQLSHQPLAGRSRDGGLRIGEMERDALISHGVSSFLQERMFYMSDFYQVNVCNKCGTFGKLSECPLCDGKDLRLTNIPYACKLLFHDLLACGIRCKINANDEMVVAD